jgi:hypothetical protein
MTERDALSKQYTEMNPEELGYEAYRNHAGEAEARMVQARAHLSPEELRKQFPYQYTGKSGTGLDINPDEAIVTTKQPGTINMPEQSIEPQTSKQDELGLHSPLENAIFGIKQPKGTGDQILKQLEKTPGVKTEELEVTGLKKYLQDNKFVTKQELQDFMEQNRLKLENKTLAEGTGEGATYDDYRLEGGDVYHDDDYINSLASDFHYDMKNDPDIFIQEKEALLQRYPDLYEGHDTNPYMDARLNQDVEDALWEQAKSQANDMYYENPIRHYYDEHGYDIYGNDDMGYSVKDPNGRFLEIGGRNGLYDLSDAEAALRDYHLEQGTLTTDEEGAAKYADYVLPGNKENYREVLVTYPDVKGKDYESNHFDEPNILAHMRVDDRTINGKKTLMVEEIQSDWHQAGRKRGYITPIDKFEKHEINQQLQSLAKDSRLLGEKRDQAEAVGNLVEKLNYINQIDDISRQINQLRKKLEGDIGVPDAPYKKNWHELMVKQALDMAAKGDYDAIAFTTGKQQADRYNLAKQIGALTYSPEGQLQAFDPSVSRILIDRNVPEDKLSDYVGQEMAKKLLDQKPNEKGHRELTGIDLEVGGEGMKGFYDKILPDYINKYTKKWGMGMKKANLGVDEWRQNLSDEELDKGLEHFGLDTKKFYSMGINERGDIYEKISRELYPMEPKDQVHFVELSDAAKKDIKEKGQPMFAGIGALAGADYLAGADEQNKTGIFKDLMKAKKD